MQDFQGAQPLRDSKIPRSLLYEPTKGYSFREREAPPTHHAIRPLRTAVKGCPGDPPKLSCMMPLDGKTWYSGGFPTHTGNRLLVQYTWSLFKRSQGRYPEEVYGDELKYNEIAAAPNPFQVLLFTSAYHTTTVTLPLPISIFRYLVGTMAFSLSASKCGGC